MAINYYKHNLNEPLELKDVNISSSLNINGPTNIGGALSVGVGGTIITTTGIGSVGIGTTNPGSTLVVNAPSSSYTGNILETQINGRRYFASGRNSSGFPYTVICPASPTGDVTWQTSNFAHTLTLSNAGGGYNLTITNQDRNSSIILDSNASFSIGDSAPRPALFGEIASTLAQRNGTNAQNFRIYNRFVSSSDFERGRVGWTTNTFIVGTEKGSTGGTARQLELQTDGTTRVAITTTGNVGIGSTLPGSTLVVNAPSGYTGNILSAQIDGTNYFSVNNSKVISVPDGSSIVGPNGTWVEFVNNIWVTLGAQGTKRFAVDRDYGAFVTSSSVLGWTAGTIQQAPDTRLYRDDASIIAQRNAGVGQTFRIYNTWTNSTNSFERANLGWSNNVFIVGTEKGSSIGTARQLELQTNGTTRVAITTTGLVGIGTTNPTSTLTVSGNSLITGIVTASTFYGSGIGLTALGSINIYYVSENGNDNNTGESWNQAYATIEKAFTVATSGDQVLIGTGVFTEVFPLTIPQGVTLKGSGLRSTLIQPTNVTKTNDAILINGDITIEDLTIANFYRPGYAFKFANGAKTLLRSPYIQRVTVLTRGTQITTDDPYGFDTPHNPPTSYAAGNGALVDGSVVDIGTLEPAILFNECTFITPNGVALEMTNGARAEWVNCWSYFADKSIYAHDGNVGLASTGKIRVKTLGFAGTTPQANDELYYLETNPVSATYSQVGTAITITKVGHGLTVGDRIYADFTSGTATDGYYKISGYVGVNTFNVTSIGIATTSGNISYQEVLGFGTITSYNSGNGLSVINGKGEGLFQLPTERPGKTVTAYGNASLSTAQEKFGSASLALDGTGDYVLVASNSDFAYGTSDFTVEFWYRKVGTGVFQLLVDQRTASVDVALAISVDNSDRIYTYIDGAIRNQGTTSLLANTWYHIAVCRSGGNTRLFVDGTQEGATYSDSNNYTAKPVRIGADFEGNYGVNGYIDEVRISNSARYTGTFIPSTTAFVSDGSDKLLLHFDGITGSTSFIDSSIPTQDVRWVRSGIATATANKITLADYQQFGGDIRSIGCASVFGNVGVSVDGPGCTLRLFAYNFGFIGSGKDFSQDISLAIQENEVVTSNGGKVYFASIDQSGDFRVGDAFYVSQKDGTVNFGAQDFTLNSLSDLNVTDGTNTTTITPTTINVGGIQLIGNEITTTSGDLTINPSGINSTFVIGDLTVTGTLNAVLTGQDGDKGDITVSANNTIWTIDQNVVTPDKLSSVTGIGTTVVLASNPVLNNITVSGIATFNDNVGIGTTNPQTKLQVGGVIGFNDTNVRIGDSNTGANLTPGLNTGINNLFIGAGAGKSTTSGTYNLFFGRRSGYYNNANKNVFVGAFGGYFTTTGAYNTFVGMNAGFYNTTGYHNNFLGYYSGKDNTTGNYNIFFGNYVGISTSASNKVIFGTGVSFNNPFDSPDTTKDTQFAVGVRTDANPSKYWLVGNENFNVGIGTTNPQTKLQVGGVIGFNDTNVRIGDSNTGANLTGGYNNIFMGVGAGKSTTTGDNNNFFGSNAGYANTSGRWNNFFGAASGRNNTTGSCNNFLGVDAGYYNTTGSNNNFFGYQAGIFNTTGTHNNFLGQYAGYCNTTGCNNNFLGTRAGVANTTGCYNNFFGVNAGYCNTTGNINTFLGSYSGYSNINGNSNIFLGSYNGLSTSASYKVIMGSGSGTTYDKFDAPDTEKDTQLAIGVRTDANPSKYWLVGNENFNVGIGTTNPTSKLYVDGDGFFVGVVTASNFYVGNNVIGGGAISGDIIVGAALSISGLSTFRNGPVLIGTATSTGTELQPLQVTGGAYVSDSVGIGITNPTTKLQVGGVIGFNDTNIRIGDNTTGGNLSGGIDNIFMGVGAGQTNSTGNHNNFLGYQAGYCNNTGSFNNFFGRYAGYCNTCGIRNNFLGSKSGYKNNIGESNNFIGWYAGYNNTDGCYNNFFGSDSGINNITGSYNNFLGIQAGSCNSTGSHNNFIGKLAGRYNTTGSHNNFFGTYIGLSTSASNKVILGRGYSFFDTFDSPDTDKDTQFAVGVRTDANPANYWLVGNENFNIGIGTTNPQTKLQVGGVLGFGPGNNVRIGDNTTGCSMNVFASDNIFMGVGAGRSNIDGSCNNFLGHGAGLSNTNGCHNNFFGHYAGCSNTLGQLNNFFGFGAGCFNTEGNNNNFLGYGAGLGNTTGSYNNFFGAFSGVCNTTGSYNNFFGFGAGRYSTIGRYNNFLGKDAGHCNDSGCYNNFFGIAAGYNNTTGIDNIFLGSSAGRCNITGSTNTFLGSYSGISTASSRKVILGSGYDITYLFDSPNTNKDTQFAVGVRTDSNPSKYWLVGNENFNIGIGTLNPTSKLYVDGDGYFSGILTANRIVSSLYGEFVGGAISGDIIVGAALSISGLSTFRNGPVLIGTATSTGTSLQQLQVTGGAYVSGSVGFGTTNPIQPFQFGSASSVIVIDSIGELGIGTTNPTEKLHVIGNILASGTVTANSDEKLKTNIRTIDNPLEKVLSLRGVEYDRIDMDDHQIGVIAQEVEKVIPQVVYPKSPHPDNETKSVAYGNIIALLIEAIKEQNKQIEEQNKRIEELEKKIRR